MEKIKLGVICGGMSTENEVSVVSASYVLSNLNKEKIGSVKKEYYDDETELDVGYATHKEAVRSLRRK